MTRPCSWGNCKASKAAIEVWVFGGEQPPKRINCIGRESRSRHTNYTLILRPCRIEFLFWPACRNTVPRVLLCSYITEDFPEFLRYFYSSRSEKFSSFPDKFSPFVSKGIRLVQLPFKIKRRKTSPRWKINWKNRYMDHKHRYLIIWKYEGKDMKFI